MPEVTPTDVALLRLLHGSERPLTLEEIAGQTGEPRTRQTFQWRLGRLRDLGYVASSPPRPYLWDVSRQGVEFIAGPETAAKWEPRWYLSLGA